MNGELAPITPGPAVPATLGPVDVLGAWLAGRNPRTLDAYSKDIADFARFVGSPTTSAAVELLLSLHHGDANAG